MRKMGWRWFSVVGVAAGLALGAAAGAQSSERAEWIVSQHGKQVGTARAQVKPEAAGFTASSVVKVDMQGLKYSLSSTTQLTPARGLAHADVSASVNGEAVRLTAEPQSGKLALTIAANGRTTTSQLALHPTAVLLPDFDAGAWENLLAVAAAQNNRDLWVVIPKNTGSVQPVLLATYADEQGTLKGQAIAVHHLVATIAGAPTQLFVGPNNELLQAEVPQDGFALVRKGFVLTPPTRAPAAPVLKPTAPQPQPTTKPTGN